MIRRSVLAVVLGVAACTGSSPADELAVAVEGDAITGRFVRDGAALEFRAESIAGDAARVDIDLGQRRIEVVLDLAAATLSEDRHGGEFTRDDRLLLRDLRDALDTDYPALAAAQPGQLVVMTADRYAEVPLGRPLGRSDIRLDAPSQEGKADVPVCADDGVKCFPGATGSSWGIFSAGGTCQVHPADYGDPDGCRGRCGSGCKPADNDRLWDCFDHDICLDYSDDCNDEFNQAANDWIFAQFGNCGAGTARPEPEPDHAESIAIAGDIESLAIDRRQRVQMDAIVTRADGTISEVTAEATWDADGDRFAIDAGLLEAADDAGAGAFTAAAEGVSVTVLVTIGAGLCVPTINELAAGGQTAADEWVEIHNGCTEPAAVSGWTLVYRSASATGGQDSALLVTLAGTMAPGERRLYASASAPAAIVSAATGVWKTGGTSGALASRAGGVALRSGPLHTGTMVDAVGYGAVATGHPFAEGGAAAPAPVIGQSIARRPYDGRDSDANAADLSATGPGGSTPGARNRP